MTISLVVFVSLQLYWLRGYYKALELDFSNKVHSVLETSTQKIAEIEIEKYLNEDYPNFGKNVISTENQPTETYIQQVTDSATRRQILFSKKIVESQHIPISQSGDSLELMKMYTDEGLISFKRNSTPSPLTSELTQTIRDNTYQLKEFAKLNATNLPIEKRVSPKVLDSVLSRELRMQGINAEFGYAIFDKDNQLTKMVNKIFEKEQNKTHYSYPLFTDGQDRTVYTLSLVFPTKDYSLAQNNFPLLLGTGISLLTILGIYIISVNYMMRQKKIADIKTDFINNMSHEFKTPLATISVATDSLNNDKIATNPEKVKYYSQLIKQENLRMKKQVENVLNMSKLERNEMQLFLKQTNMRELIQRLTESFRLIVEEREGTLTQEFTAENFNLKVDEFHFSNALVNLLDNANKYSPEKPEIKVKTRNEGNKYVIEISDKGMGMETFNKKKIFEKFFREETGNIHNVKGQGLGLSYVKRIIELHGGQVLVDSVKGKGSTFTIKLPL
jgi:two-component system phosphate regulon sensor histidine kinase PhoR